MSIYYIINKQAFKANKEYHIFQHKEFSLKNTNKFKSKHFVKYKKQIIYFKLDINNNYKNY